MKKMGWLLAAVILVSANAIASDSLSDLYIKGFKSGDPMQIKNQRSPFMNSNPSKKDLAAEDLQLTGVAYNSNIAFALISGHIVTEGEFIGNFRVTSVRSGEVVLKRLDETYVLKLGGGL